METLINKIKETIKGTKFEGKSYIAGGYVRDLVLGLPNKDIDIVVELPNGGIELAEFLTKELGGTNVVIFERFGTAQIVVDGIDLEFVMTRKEEYTKGSRKPEVVFGTIKDDVLRRDFTINSMLLNISTGEILDLLGGKEDLKLGIIKTTSDPKFIFTEDPLRILRGIRFACRFGYKIESETRTEMLRSVKSIETISKERVREEFMKILISDKFEEGLSLMIDLGLDGLIGLKELGLTLGMEQNDFHSKDVLGHIIDVITNAKKTPLHRLAALLHDIGKVNTKSFDVYGVTHFYEHELMSYEISKRFMKSLKFSTEDIDLVSTAVMNHMRITNGITDGKLRKIRSELGDDKYMFLLDLCEADRLTHKDVDVSHIERARMIKESEKNITASNLVINGNEIMEMFNLKQGKEVGLLLKRVSELMFDSPDITKDEVIRELRNIIG
jgi:poly(A) polymerase